MPISDRIPCGDPEQPMFSIVSRNARRAIYTCIAGYKVVGDAFRTCRASGTWSGKPPTCQGTSSVALSHLDNTKEEEETGNRDRQIAGSASPHSSPVDFSQSWNVPRRPPCQTASLRCPASKASTSTEWRPSIGVTPAMSSGGTTRGSAGPAESGRESNRSANVRERRKHTTGQ